MTRVRSAAQRAPQTIEAATDLAGRFAELDAQLAKIEADRQDELAKINGAADAAIVPIVAKLKDIAKQLKPWWAAHFETLTDGKRKSIELGGCMLGYRVSPPKVTFAHGTDEDGARLLKRDGHDALVREKISLDKPAVLKALDGEHGDALREAGFGMSQREDFFLERVAQGGTLTA